MNPERVPIIEPPPETRYARVKRAFDRFIHHPVTEMSILILIVVSVVLMVVEVAVVTNPVVLMKIEELGWGITFLFALELLIRFWVARKKSRFFQRYWLDILAVIPLVRPLRFFRIFRVLRLFRAGVLLNRRVSVFHGVMRSTASELTALAAITVILILASAMMLHLGEGPVNTDFERFDMSLWFAVFSLVGGEPIGGQPNSELGRWATLILMLGGVTVFGMFVGTVSASMASRLTGRLRVNEMDLDELSGHVVVCGWNRSGPTVVQELFGSSNPMDRSVVVLTENRDPPSDMPEEGVRQEHLYHHYGDYTRVEVLQEVGIAFASCAILLTDALVPRSDQDRDARTVLASLTIERLAPGIFTIAELTNRQNESLLRLAGVEEIVVGDWYSGVILGSASRNRGLVRVLDEVLTTEKGNAFYTTAVPAAKDGATILELHQTLLRDHQALLISVEQADDPNSLQVNPPPDRAVQAGDRLVVLAHGKIRW